jgi:hypothetical protein
MLVGAFQIQIRRKMQFWAAFQHRGNECAGIEPHVQRVPGFVIIRRIRAQQFRRIEFKPGVNAALLDALRCLFHQFQRVRVQFAGLLVSEQRDRHAPIALAGNAPVGPVSHHALQPRFAPIRGKPHPFDILQGAGAQPVLLHADEPLRGSAEDDRRLVPPAMRIAVIDRAIRNSIPCAFSVSITRSLAANTCKTGEQRSVRQKRPSGPTGLSTFKP